MERTEKVDRSFNFTNKTTPSQVLFWEFSKIFPGSYCIKLPGTAASGVGMS